MHKTIYVPDRVLEQINRYLATEPKSADECLGEDGAIVYTANFGDGYEMDIKCCGVRYFEGDANMPWTEAVLFLNGSELRCSEPSEDFEGEWVITYGGEDFIVDIVPESKRSES